MLKINLALKIRMFCLIHLMCVQTNPTTFWSAFVGQISWNIDHRQTSLDVNRILVTLGDNIINVFDTVS